MDERLSVEERLLSQVRDGIDAAIVMARAAGWEGVVHEDDKIRELAMAVEKAALDLDNAMVTLLDEQSSVEDQPETEE